MRKRVLMLALILAMTCRAGLAQTDTVVVRPQESDEVLVNPGMGIQTFQRFNGQPLNEGLKWSEEGPLGREQDAASKPDFPRSSVAYCRWFWSALQPSPDRRPTGSAGTSSTPRSKRRAATGRRSPSA